MFGRHKIFRSFLLVVIAALLTIAGCGGGGGSSGTVPAADVSGAWSGIWYSSVTEYEGTLTLEVDQEGSTLTGEINVTNSPCLATALISGMVSGNTVTLSAVSGADGMQISGILSGNVISGEYTITAGLCAGDSGNFILYQDTNNTVTDTTTLATAVPFPTSLTVNANTLYWSDKSSAPVRKITLPDQNLSDVVKAFGDPESMIVSDQELYWIGAGAVPSSSCTGDGLGKTLVRSSLDGNTSVIIASGENCAGGVNDIIADTTYLYWIQSTFSPNTYTIRRVAKAGGEESVLYSTMTPIVSMASDGISLYWLESFFPSAGIIRKMPLGGGEVTTVLDGNSGYNAFVGDIVVDGAELFVAEVQYPYPGTARLLKVDLNTASVGEVGILPALPRKLATDSTNVYWIDADSINLIPKSGGAVVSLAGGLASPVDIRVEGTELFWVETVCCAHGQTGRIKKISVSGGAVTTLIDGVNAPQSVVINGTDMYWIEGGPVGSIEGFGRIEMMPLGGGEISPIISGIITGTMPIAVDDAFIYIADRWMIKKLPKAGGKITNVAEADFAIFDIDTDGTNIYWIEDGPFTRIAMVASSGGPVVELSNTLVGPSGPLMTVGGYVYWIAHYDTISRVSVLGGATETVAGGLSFLSDFTTDGTDVFFPENDTGKIRKVPVSGGSISELVLLDSAAWRILAVDDTHLFWIDLTLRGSMLGSIPKTGGISTVLYENLDYFESWPNSLVVDDVNLYWTEVGSGTIKMAPKP
ncbi:hypothetical protein WCX18_09940 [Sulfurimonas sp. HSL1-2]|uniref:hypothetical protein n=1 Tax=Thiomicrolovo zhangzhouensis TaxID=3131933 RepID=UPI0031FA2652